MWITECDLCSGSGACDPCQGYGVLSDSYPNAGDGPECDVCCGDGICPDCCGTGEGIDDTDPDDDVNNTIHNNELAVSGEAGWKASA